MESSTYDLKRENREMKLFTWKNIPYVALANPKLVHLDSKTCQIQINTSRIKQNHLRSMYFAVLLIGAEVSIGVPTTIFIREIGLQVDHIFKDMWCEFKKRATDDVIFQCNEVDKVKSTIAAAASSPERQEATISGFSYLKSDPNKTSIMNFRLTLSVKKRG